MRRGRILSGIMTFTMLISALSASSGYMAAPSDENTSNRSEKVSEYRKNLNYHNNLDLDLDFSFADEEESKLSRNWGAIPKSYSSSSYVDWDFERVNDYITSVKSQNPYGTCWAHSTIAAAESTYIINEEINDIESVDFNEYHLVHYTYDTPSDPLGLFGGDETILESGDTYLNTGGSNISTASVLANWMGASDSKMFGPNDVEGDQPDALAFEDAAHLEDAYFVTMPDMTSENYQADMNVVKNLLMKYGAMVVSYCSTYEGGDEFDGYYYCPVNYLTNHAVTVIGWDDTIPADSFKTTAPGDGAWLVKNSWGDYGDFGGYFWLSYYDYSLEDEAYVYDMVSADNYDNNYQYDGTSGTCFEAYMDTVVFANAFVADSKESLEAVGFYTYDVNVDYEIRIYKNLEDNEAPQNGELVLTQTGNENYAGYHTQKLQSAINLASGERYAVVVSLFKKGQPCYAAVDETIDYGWISFKSYAKAGESYIGYTLNSLEDLNPKNLTYAEGRNVRLKAYTNEGEKNVIASGTCGDNLTWTLGEDYTLTISGTGDMWSNYHGDPDYHPVGWSDYYKDIKKIVFLEGVTSVGANCFNGYTGLEEVVFTDTITEIGYVAFGSCANLKNFDLPANLEYFGQDCFTNCDTITELILPDTITYYGGGNTGCDSLEYVYIGGSPAGGTITSVSNLFTGCKALKEIEVSANNRVYKSVDGVLFNKSGNEVICYPAGKTDATYQVPAGTTRINHWSFKNAQHLVNVILPEGITSIDTQSFYGCSSLASFVIPSTVTQFGRFILSYSDNVQYIYNKSNTPLDLSGMTNGNWVDVNGNVITSITNGIAILEGTEFIEETGVSLNLTTATLNSGDTLQLASTVTPSNAMITDVTYTSSDESLATVDKNGLVKVNTNGKAGTVVITATTASAKKTATCIITVKPVWVSSITLDKTSLELVDGNADILTATVAPTNASNKAVAWSSSNTTVATVDGNGKVTAVGVGTATITATAKDGSGASTNCNVTVTQRYTNGLNEYTDGKLYYFKDNKIDTTYNGLAEYHEETWYVKNGAVDTSVNGLKQVGNNWYLFATGKVNRTTTLVSYGGAWWYVENGQINFNYDGLADYDGRTWYIEDSRVDFDKNGIHQRGGWYYFKDGAIDRNFTGLTNSFYGWWYVEKGNITFNYNNLVYYNGSWWYVENSNITFNYDGLADYDGRTWYIEDSRVDFNKNGIHQRGGWYYFKDGAIDRNFTGLTNSFYGWWYIEKGNITFSYTDLVQYAGSWWYVENSNITFKYDGVVDYAGNTWYIEDSKVDFNKNGLHQRGDWYYFKGGAVERSFTGLTNSPYGWWYVEKGNITFQYTNLVYYNGSWWYVQNSNITFNYDGLADYAGSTWYIQDSRVDFSYNGTYRFKNQTYRIVNGQATLVK